MSWPGVWRCDLNHEPQVGPGLPRGASSSQRFPQSGKPHRSLLDHAGWLEQVPNLIA